MNTNLDKPEKAKGKRQKTKDKSDALSEVEGAKDKSDALSEVEGAKGK